MVIWLCPWMSLRKLLFYSLLFYPTFYPMSSSLMYMVLHSLRLVRLQGSDWPKFTWYSVLPSDNWKSSFLVSLTFSLLFVPWLQLMMSDSKRWVLNGASRKQQWYHALLSQSHIFPQLQPPKASCCLVSCYAMKPILSWNETPMVRQYSSEYLVREIHEQEMLFLSCLAWSFLEAFGWILFGLEKSNLPKSTTE